MNLTIREVTAHDAAAVAGILNRIVDARIYSAFDTRVTPEDERRYIESFPARGVFLVAVRSEDDRIVGFQSMEPFASFTHAFDHVGVLGTYVDLDCRRQGVASRLFAATFALARQKGYRKIFTYVRADNPVALTAYARQGFRIVGTAHAHAHLDGRDVDEVIVEKLLDAAPTETSTLRIYHEFADWFHLLTAPAEYAEEAAYYQQAILDACEVTPRTLLELGSGGGNNASHLKARFEMTLVEPSAGMLAVSRRVNPDCEHVQGDMRTVRLDRQFDAVFVHDAVVYMTSEADLRQAIETAYAHCKRGGAALFAPDAVRETFRGGTEHGGHDGEGRSLRYLEWHWDPDPADQLYTVDYALMLKDRDGSIRIEHDHHVEGLFSRDEWLRWLADAGFDATVLRIDHSELEPGSYEVFVGKKR